MNDLDIITRLKQVLELDGSTVNSFARQTGIDPGNLRKMLDGKQKITDKTLRKISDACEIKYDWLKFGEGEMHNASDSIEPNETRDLGRVQTVPLIPVEAFAGPIAAMLSEGTVDRECRRVVAPMAGAEMAIPVSGDSMEPVIHDGAILYIARINERAFIPWGNIMVLDTENGALVKEVYPSPTDNDAVQVRSINPKYPPFDVPKDSIRGIYRVLGFSKYYSTY